MLEHLNLQGNPILTTSPAYVTAGAIVRHQGRLAYVARQFPEKTLITYSNGESDLLPINTRVDVMFYTSDTAKYALLHLEKELAHVPHIDPTPQ